MPRPKLYATRSDKDRAYRQRKIQSASHSAPTPGPTLPDTPPGATIEPTHEPHDVTTIPATIDQTGTQGRVSPASELSPPRARSDSKRRVPVCHPASQSQYQRAIALMAEGRTWTEIEDDTGAGWNPIKEAAYSFDAFDEFTAAEEARKQAITHRIAGKAMACAFDGSKRKRVVTTKADGSEEATETVEHYADPAFARIAGEYTDPATHGRQAGRADVTVNVANVIGLTHEESKQLLQLSAAQSRPVPAWVDAPHTSTHTPAERP